MKWANPSGKPLLAIRELVKSYALGQHRLLVLDDLSLEMEKGEMVVIMGPSGSGKTTLLNCIAGIDSFDSGSLFLAGESVSELSEKKRTLLRRRQIGMVFQFFNLIPTLTAKENVALPFMIDGKLDREHRERVETLLSLVGLQERKAHYPSQLSGGEMQLVSIARALVRGPQLLLADEPTGNVNPAASRSILEILRNTSKAEGCGVVLVTHNAEHAAWGDRICFLKDGGIVKQLQHDGKTEQVATIYKQLLELGI